jgi:transcription initiation factor TFIID TATA-box-binding protein
MAKIVNIVATGELNHGLDLNFLAQNLDNIIYNPNKFTAAVLRLPKEQKTTFLLFKSGKFVCTGAKKITDAKGSSEKMCETIRRIIGKNDLCLLNFIVQNVVASYDIGFKINLERFYDCKRTLCLYEPEFFPGLRFLPSKKEKKTILIFISGKIVLTGYKK